MKFLSAILFLFFLTMKSVFAQFSVTEGMGTILADMDGVEVSDHAFPNNRFDLSNFTYFGTALIVNHIFPSPNGGLAAFFGTTEEDFGILGINTSGCTSANLSFQVWKSSGGSGFPIPDTEFVVEYSTNGGASFTPVSWGSHSGSTPWEAKSGLALPIHPDIQLIFRTDITASQQMRLDGITITGLGPCNFVLPVEFARFTAKRSGNAVILDWSTASERNNSHFVVERSADGRVFAAIDEVRGAGSTTVLQQYKYTDDTPLQYLSYYRLKQVDFDGRFKYSPIRSVLAGRRGEIVMAPSPATDRVTAVLEAAATEGGDWQVFDASGRLAQSGVWPAEAGRLDLDVAALPQGIYMFRLMAGPRVQVKAFKKQ
jgi:hypothetical protein